MSITGSRRVGWGALLVALAIAGCGSSKSSSSSGSTTGSASTGLSKAALVSSADAICTRHRAVITAGSQKMLAGGKLPTPATFGKFAMGTVIPQTSAQVQELSALKPSASEASSYDQWLASLRTTVAKMKQNPVVIQHSATFKTVNGQATALGLKACQVGPGS